LAVLISNAGLTIPTSALKDRVWGKPVSDAALAVFIHKLRKKLEPDPQHPVYIENIRGLGYRFNGKPTRASLASLKYGCGNAGGSLTDAQHVV
jgi:DNA-binding response OmpR family regulator